MSREVMRKVTTPIAALLAVFVLAGARTWASEELVLDGSTTVGPIAKAFAEFYMKNNPGVNITVSESGSGNGAKGLINGTCQIAAMSRFMKESEFKAAVAAGITPVAHMVALDGIAVVVHPANPVKGISLSQLKEIYLGKITNWNQLGGPNAMIVAISRDTNSGTFETFETIAMQGERMAASIEYVGSNGALRSRVQNTQAALGFIGVGFLDSSVKGLVVEGVYPTLETVKTGEYPLSRPLYMFTNGVPEMGSVLWKYITLHLSEKGQTIIEEIGFVPITDY